MYDVMNLSEYIITKCIKENHLINSMQLQYILYYIQKSFLIEKDKLAFLDDIRVKAWGPAISSVYDRYCGYGTMPIFFSPAKYNVAKEDKQLIDSIIESKRVLTPWDLAEELRRKDKVWKQICKKRPELFNKRIPVSLLKVAGRRSI